LQAERWEEIPVDEASDAADESTDDSENLHREPAVAVGATLVEGNGGLAIGASGFDNDLTADREDSVLEEPDDVLSSPEPEGVGNSRPRYAARR
jgi:hypothetical protein